MLSVVIAVLLSAGASGSSPTAAVYGAMGAEFVAATPINTPRATLLAPTDGVVTRLHWESSAAGTDGGGSTFTLAATADGTPACSATIACTLVGDGDTTCSGAFTAEQDLHVVVTASDCATLPALLTSVTWRQ
jgi:hypothetical protein